MLPPGNVNDPTRPTRSLLFLVQIRLKIFLAAANGGHETDAVALRDRSRPTFQFDKTPVSEIRDLAGLGISLGRKDKKLHPLFDDPDLGHAAHFIVIKDPCAQGLE